MLCGTPLISIMDKGGSKLADEFNKHNTKCSWQTYLFQELGWKELGDSKI